MNIHLSKQLLHWNSLYQQLNEIYRQYATQKGVSETTLWLLYFLCEHGGSCEQRALCRSLLDPPQTVNSSLKKLEQQGLVSLQLVAGSRKNKEVSLTEVGEQFAKTTVLPLMAAEQQSFSDLSEREQLQMLTLMQKHQDLLRMELERAHALTQRRNNMSKKIQLSDHFTYGRLLRFVMPSILMILCTSVYTIVDGFFVSNYVGKTAFAALNLVWPVLMAVSTIGFLIGTGGCALVSKTLGEGNRERANQYFSMLITVTFIGTVILSAIGFLLTPQIVTLLGAKGAEMQANSILYGRILFVGIPFMVLQQAFLSFYVAAEKPSLSLIVSIVSGVINMILDYMLIVPLDMGLAGAALATVLSQVIGGIFPVIYFLRKNSSLLRLQFPFPMHWKALWIACANGSSEMVSNLSVSLVSMLYNYQLMRLVGEDGISAYGVLMYVSVVFNAVFMGYSIGSAPIVSYHYGAKNHAELKNLFQKGLWLISGSSVIITALAIGFAKQQAMIFTSHDADLMALTIQACQIYSIAYLFKGINTWASSFFTALNNGLVSALISFLRTFLFEIAAILILPAFFGVLGIWFSVVAAELAALVVSIAFLAANRKKYQY